MVARLLWEQDAAGSTPVTPTTGFPIGSPFFYNFGHLCEPKQPLGAGDGAECCRWQMKRGVGR